MLLIKPFIFHFNVFLQSFLMHFACCKFLGHFIVISYRLWQRVDLLHEQQPTTNYHTVFRYKEMHSVCMVEYLCQFHDFLFVLSSWRFFHLKNLKILFVWRIQNEWALPFIIETNYNDRTCCWFDMILCVAKSWNHKALVQYAPVLRFEFLIMRLKIKENQKMIITIHRIDQWDSHFYTKQLQSCCSWYFTVRSFR